MEKMTFDEALWHTGSLSTQGIEQTAARALMHYIWIEPDCVDDSGFNLLKKPEKNQKMGFCTNCLRWYQLQEVPDWVVDDPYCDDITDDNPEFLSYDPWENWPKNKYKKTGKVKHGDLGHCPGCGAKVQYRSLNMGYRTQHERILLIVYQKSMAEENAITCVGYDIKVNWRNMDRNGPYEPPMEIEPVELCVFRYGKSADRFLLKRRYIWEHDENKGYRINDIWTEWEHMGKCISGYQPGVGMGGNSVVRTVLDYRSYLDAMNGTVFEKIWNNHSKSIKNTDTWNYYDKISVMAKLTKYPCVEYLYKLGYDAIATYVIDNNAGKELYLRGKTARSVLRLSEAQWGEVKGKKLILTPAVLRMARYVQKNKLRLNMELCVWISRQGSYAGHDGEIIDNLRKAREVDTVKAIKYCNRKGVALRDYLDYVVQIRELKMSYKDKATVFPQNFEEMHTRLSDRISIQADAIAKKRLLKITATLGGYCFSAFGFVLRPFISTEEVVREGTVLHHCVGGYAKSYAAGKTVLCCLREETALYRPMYTVEFTTDGRLVQCRGDHNRTRPEDEERLAQFWHLFDMMRADLAAQKKKEEKRLKAEAEKAERKAA
ncbi:MAG: PcfJ domain-containing protein [Eubacteriales bacterium]|nr:PcfJ domain-containing protein [Eubacteriales bacterium]